MVETPWSKRPIFDPTVVEKSACSTRSKSPLFRPGRKVRFFDPVETPDFSTLVEMTDFSTTAKFSINNFTYIYKQKFRLSYRTSLQ